MRTRTSKTLELADGSFETHVARESINFRDAGGRWKPIDNTLEASATGLRNRANRYRLTLPRRLGGDSVRVASGRAWIEFAPVGAQPVAARRDGASAIYADAWRDVELRYSAQGDAVKEEIVVRRLSDLRDFRFDLKVSPGFTLKPLPSGALELRDARDRVALRISRSTMVDAKGAARAVRADLLRTESGWNLTLRPDRTWLRAPDRAWPLVIDPTVTFCPADYCADGLVCEISNPESSDPDGYCGDTVTVGEAPGNPRRVLLRFDLGNFSLGAGSRLDYATIEPGAEGSAPISEFQLYEMTADWDENADWVTRDGTTPWSMGPAGQPGGGAQFDRVPQALSPDGFTELVNRWVSGTTANHGVQMTRSSGCLSCYVQPFLVLYWSAPTGVRDTDAVDTNAVSANERLLVNLASGSLTLQSTDALAWHTLATPADADAPIWTAATPAGIGARVWNSFDPGSGSFGHGSRLAAGVDVRLAPLSGGAKELTGPGGVHVVFTPDGNGGYNVPQDFPAILEDHPDGSARVTLYSGDRLDFSPWAGGTGGYFVKWSDHLGSAVDYLNDGDVNDSLVDLSGQTGTVTNTAPGVNRIASVATAEGEFSYGYTNGYLTSFTDANGQQTTYDFDGDLLTGVHPPVGDDWTIDYDDDRRVASLTRTPPTGPPAVITYAYGPNTTTVTYPSGPVIYQLNADGTSASVVDEGASPPTVTLGGSLPSSAPHLPVIGQKDLDVTISDADGIGTVAVRVDDAFVVFSDSLCPSSPCTLSDVFVLDSAAVGRGVHTVEVFAGDDGTSQRVVRFPVYIPPGPLAQVQPEEPAVDDESEEQIDRAKAFRSAVGLDASDGHVRAVQATAAYKSSAVSYGIYLTPGERAHMAERNAVQHATSVIDSYGAEHSDEYAELYVTSDGMVHVGFTGHESTHLAALQALFPYPTKLTVFTAQRTRDDLADITNAISDDVDELETAGIEVVRFGENVIDNTVEVGVKDLTSTEESYLESHYGPGVVALEESEDELTAGSRYDKWRPLVGGLRVDPAHAGPCTNAFSATGYPPLPSQFRFKREERIRYFARFTFTAGHCSDRRDMDSWEQGGEVFGATFAWRVATGSSTDSMLISLNPGITGSSAIWIRKELGRVVWKRVMNTTDYNVDDRGHDVCISGIASGFVCGQITETRQVVPVRWRNEPRDKMYVQAVRKTNFPCKDGDSGAPVFSRNEHGEAVDAIGIVMSSSRTSCSFTHIGHALDIMRVRKDIEKLRLVVGP